MFFKKENLLENTLRTILEAPYITHLQEYLNKSDESCSNLNKENWELKEDIKLLEKQRNSLEDELRISQTKCVELTLNLAKVLKR